jgi:hypothetical protein
VQIAVIWTVSDAGYYFLLPALGAAANYNAGSVAVTLYYAFWIGIAVITFWPLYRSWPRYGRWATFENRLTSYIAWSLAFAACIFFGAYVLPSLPAITWTESWKPPDVRVATPRYFLPKSIEFLFSAAPCRCPCSRAFGPADAASARYPFTARWYSEM